MSDARLRTLARAAARDPAQRARAVQERFRARLIDENLLRLAAHLGDPTARAVLRAAPVRSAPMHPQLRHWNRLRRRRLTGLRIGPRTWLGEVGAFGPDACLRALVAIGELALPLVVEARQSVIRGALDAAIAYLDCPCVDHADEAQIAHERVDALLLERHGGPPVPGALAEHVARWATRLAGCAAAPGAYVGIELDLVALGAARQLGAEVVEGSVRAALISWALESDGPRPELVRPLGLAQRREAALAGASA